MEFTEKAMAPHSSTLAWKIPWIEMKVPIKNFKVLTIMNINRSLNTMGFKWFLAYVIRK